MIRHILLLLVCFLSGLLHSYAQPASRFQSDIQTIKQYDKIYAPPKAPILFIGSSSIRLWSDLERTFSDDVVLNRGIGGAVVNDISFYVDSLVTPYEPRQVLIYVGENNIGDGATSETVLTETQHLLTLIRQRFPNIPISYIAMKPSPSRDKYRAALEKANTLIRQYITTQKNMSFIDVYTPMLTADGKSRPELFLEDQLHMNQQGYDIWIKEITPHLLKR